VSPLAAQPWELLCGALRPARIFDLRAPEAFARGHLAGAECLPYERFQGEVLGLLAAVALAEDDVLIVDPGGARAAEMAVWLRTRGLPARFLEGGYAAWTGPLVDPHRPSAAGPARPKTRP